MTEEIKQTETVNSKEERNEEPVINVNVDMSAFKQMEEMIRTLVEEKKKEIKPKEEKEEKPKIDEEKLKLEEELKKVKEELVKATAEKTQSKGKIVKEEKVEEVGEETPIHEDYIGVKDIETYAVSKDKRSNFSRRI